MLLAEALRERADAQRALNRLRARIVANARTTEGEEAAEDAEALLAQAEAVLDTLATRIAAINATNLATRLPDGRTLTQALADRDTLRGRHALLTEAAQAASGKAHARFARQELRTFAALDVAGLHQQADQVAADIRALDIDIQRVNVTTDLVQD